MLICLPGKIRSQIRSIACTNLILSTSQFTRDALIEIAGSKAKGRDFVYFTEVKDIPSTDLATIERLWSKFSGGKFGYSVQKVSRLPVSPKRPEMSSIRQYDSYPVTHPPI